MAGVPDQRQVNLIQSIGIMLVQLVEMLISASNEEMGMEVLPAAGCSMAAEADDKVHVNIACSTCSFW